MTQHPQAELLRMVADNEDQMFECPRYGQCNIKSVLAYPELNWRPVKQTKTITRWLWANNDGRICKSGFYSEKEIKGTEYTIKLEWSATEFEVDDE